eukprot:GHVR01011979.1.p1 GENE.GHVR01011979.1~~GHVR01011979.1.p1  ORF type:complete len:299 (+),score=47.47 GHVR01011979.1:60-956(+)
MFTYIQYQAFTLLLVCSISVVLLLLEIVMRKYNILPYTFGAFKVEKRRMYCFSVDITVHKSGREIRKESKMVVRMILILALAFVWELCVVENIVSRGSLPLKECGKGMDCFVAPLRFTTVFQTFISGGSDFTVDCSDVLSSTPTTLIHKSDFVNCVRFRDTNAIHLLTQCAITYSLCMLSLRSYELLIWFCLKAWWIEFLYYTVAILYVISMIFLFVFGTFVNSFLAYVITFEFPCLLKFAGWSARHLKKLSKMQNELLQAKIHSTILQELEDKSRGLDSACMLFDDKKQSHTHTLVV